MQDIEKQIKEMIISTWNSTSYWGGQEIVEPGKKIDDVVAELLSLFTTLIEEKKGEQKRIWYQKGYSEAEANNEALLAVKEHRKRAEATINRIQMFPCPCGVTSVHFHGIENQKRIKADKELEEKKEE